jgi:CRISPR/Cas system CMR-associated protein Cmr3 (group 5 of RAMP superfamily)
MMYVAEFTPVSGLVFRDARPFQAGQDTVSANIDFPPPPEAFWSALNRSLAALGQRGILRRLRVRAYYLADKDGPLLPAMADLFTVTPADDLYGEETFRILRPHKVLSRIARGPEQLELLWLGEQVAHSHPCERSFLRPDSFLCYLLDEVQELTRFGDLVSIKSLFYEEQRTGVQLSGRNAQEGRLYTEKIVFPNIDRQVRFCLVFDTPSGLKEESALADRLVHLGGEGKLARLRIFKTDGQKLPVLPSRAREQVFSKVINHGSDGQTFRLKLCLMSPAVYSARKELLWCLGTRTPSWRPFWMHNASNGWCRPIFDNQSYRLRLVAAAAGKAVPLGAWDRARQIPKPLHRCQPAGAVYYLELEPRNGTVPEKALNDFFDDFWLGTLLVRTRPAKAQTNRKGQTSGRSRDTISSHGLRGFGWTTIGVWNYA